MKNVKETVNLKWILRNLVWALVYILPIYSLKTGVENNIF